MSRSVQRDGTRSRARRRTPTERLPLPALFVAIIAIAFFALPFLGLLWRAPWSTAWARAPARRRSARRCGSRSSCSLVATALSLVFGVPLAWLLARVDFPGRGVVRALCTLSMVLPPVVGGVALFFSFGRRGLFGQYLDRWFDLRLPFTTCGRGGGPDVRGDAVPGAHRRGGAAPARRPATRRRPARSARSRWYVFRRVTLPTIRRRWSPAPCSRGPARSASSARRSPSPATSRAPPRRCRWPPTWRCSRNPQEALVLSLRADRRVVRRAASACATAGSAAAAAGWSG